MSLQRIGSQLFINRNDTAQNAREWVDRMNETGLSVIRLFMMWDLVEKKEGDWDFEVFDAVFDQASLHNIGVVPTLFYFTAPGWMKTVRSCQGIDYEWKDDFIKKADFYVDKVVSHYANHPALDSWIVWNEATLEMKINRIYEKEYQGFLKKYHGSIEAYNKLSYYQYDDFSQIELKDSEVDFWKPHIEQLDWARFNRSKLLYWLKHLRDRVYAIDSKHAIHVNPHALVSNHTHTGQEVWEEGRMMDFLGCSAHPVWHFTRFDRECWPQAIAMSTILMRSASKGDRFWLSELQAGPAIDSGLVPDCPSAEDLRVWMWTGLSTGAESIVFWCFNDRDDGAEAGEWRLMGPTGKETRRSRITKDLCLFLSKNKDWFGTLKARKPKACILHSTPSRTFASMAEPGSTENPRSQESCDDSICGAWTLLDDLGIEAGFVDEVLLGSLDPLETPVLILPNVTCIEKKNVLSDLVSYVHKGGILFIDGVFALKDQEGWILREDQDQVEALIGAQREDIYVFRGEERIQTKEGEFQGWFSRNDFLPFEETEVLARWGDNYPAIIQSCKGQGRVITIGTCFFQRYFAKKEEALRKQLKSFMKDIFQPETLIVSNSEQFPQVRQTILESEKGEVSLFINNGDATELELRISRDVTIKNMQNGELTNAVAGDSIALSLPTKDCIALGVEMHS